MGTLNGSLRRNVSMAVLAGASVTAVVLVAQQPAAPPPLVKENATVKVSEHVYVIPDGRVGGVPNVGIIVGNKATLVVDTGLGPRNGQTVLREVAKVSKNTELYLVTTHFHPEHTLGAAAFPATAKYISSEIQEKDVAEFGRQMRDTFSQTPVRAELLKDVEYRRADIVFNREKDLDLGGVRVRMFALGPTHTRGDTGFFVEGDAVLFSGDVVMNGAFLAFNMPYGSVRTWLTSLDRLEALHPRTIVPSHGEMGDASLIGRDRDFLRAVQTRIRELKSQNRSADQAAELVRSELQAKYPDWTAPNRILDAAKAAYAESP